jgi:hypothetical protein
VNLAEWGAKWRVPMEALRELEQHMGVGPQSEPKGAGEAEVAQRVRLAASRSGVWLTRNNVGALKDSRGRLVRYGLANETPAQNRGLKSGDDIGITPLLIEPHHVGMILGQFTSVEYKRQGWRYTGAGREPAQLAWATHVERWGGRALFCSSVDDWERSGIAGCPIGQ